MGQVAASMTSLVLLLQVEGPVGIEVAVGGEGAEFEYGFGSGEGPAGTGDVQAIFDQVAAGAFDDAGGDRSACPQGGGVVQVGLVGGQISGAGVGSVAFGGRVAEPRGPSPDVRCQR